MTDRAAVVLAGGFATRFEDGDKTLARLDGEPLLAHVLASLSPAVEQVVVSCRDEQIAPFESASSRRGLDVQFCPDETPDSGPLWGLADALEALDGGAGPLAVATADMPCVPTGLWRLLFDRLGKGANAVAISDGGYCEPAPAVFAAGPLREVVATRRAAGDAQFRAVFDGVAVETVSAELVRERWEARALADVDTLDDLERLRNSLGE